MTKLNRTSLYLAAIVAMSTSVYAQTATVPTAPIATVSSIALEMANRVCAGTFVLSDNAKLACLSKKFPRELKDGSRFVNTGIGAEFNTLGRQIVVATTPTTTN